MATDPVPAVLPVGGVDVGGVVGVTRRQLWKALVFLGTPDTVVKVLTHAAAGGAGYGSKWMPWFRELGRRDFNAENDDSMIQVARLDAARMVVTVTRTFKWRAKNSGKYTFFQENPDVKWTNGKCVLTQHDIHYHMSIRLPDHDNPDPSKRHPYSQLVAPTIRVAEGELLTINLVSSETHPTSRRFYSYRIGSSIDDSTFTWAANPADLTSSLQLSAWLYSENDKSVLEDLQPEVPKKATQVDDGYNVL